MIAALVRLDARLLLRSRLALAMLLLLVAAAALALAGGLDWRARYTDAAADARIQVAKDAAVLREIYIGTARGDITPTDVRTFDGNGEYTPDPRDPYVAGWHHTQIAELPAGPLLGMATGTTELHATHHLIKSVPLDGILRVGVPAERVNPGALAAGRFDLLTFIALLCPLVLIALLYDVLGREREAGLTPLLAALGATAGQLLLARGMLRGGIVIVVAVAASLCGFVLIGLDDFLTGLLWTVGIVLYLGLWTLLVLCVASLRTGTAGAAGAAIACWVALLLLSPAILERAARPHGLLEPRVLADAEVRRVLRVKGAPEAIEESTREVAQRYWNIDFEQAPACAYRADVVPEFVRRRLADEHYAAAMRIGMAKEALFDARLDRWSWLSPALAFRRAMERIAGVDAARQRLFAEEVIRYHAQWRGRVTDALFNCQSFDRRSFEAAPRFVWRNPPKIDPSIAGGAVTLAACCGLAGIFAMRKRPLFF